VTNLLVPAETLQIHEKEKAEHAVKDKQLTKTLLLLLLLLLLHRS
jgi:hypothetical protein